MKTLIVIHRALREVDPTFHEELINYGRSRSHMLNMSHFKDDSSPNGASVFLSVIDFIIIFIIMFLDSVVSFIVLLLSMGLFCMGPHLCIIFGGKAGMFPCVEV